MKKKNISLRSVKWITAVFVTILFCIIPTVLTNAASAKILSTTVYEENIYVYIRGISSFQKGSTIQIGNTVCSKDQVSMAEFHSMDGYMRMLIFVDNSKSIPDNKHTDIQAILNGIVSESGENMLFKIGTFSDHAEYLCDYTNDRNVLADAINSVSYNDQDTYLSDVLYDAISQLGEEDTSACTRILILSDGADNNSIGYTNDEVRNYIEKNAYPVYTIGIPGKNNSSELETMFSFSRASNSEYFLLDENSSAEEILSILLQDEEGICLKITPDESLKDGSNKNILLRLDTEEGMVELKTKADMPFGNGMSSELYQKEEVTEKEELVETESMDKSDDVLPTLSINKENVEVPADKKETPWLLAAVVLVGIVVLLIVLFVVLILRKKKEGNHSEEENQNYISERQNEDQINNFTELEAIENTVMEENFSERDDAKPLWHEMHRQFYLVLKHLDNCNIMYKVPIVDVIHIGRKKTSDIFIDDSKVSWEHCEFILKGELLYIKDCNSTNGTYYENSVVHDETPVISGGQISLGRHSGHRYSVELIKE